MVEGSTEKAFLACLREFLTGRLAGRKAPKLDPMPYHGRLPTKEKLRVEVQSLLSGRNPADAVIALTDVYTGSRDFDSAEDAKDKMHRWVGLNKGFYPHVALHEFEAWLLPYWERICHLAGSHRKPPGPHPEQVNHGKPPSKHLQEVFRLGGKRDYSKTREPLAILKGQRLDLAIAACPELRALVNRILELSGGEKLP